MLSWRCGRLSSVYAYWRGASCVSDHSARYAPFRLQLFAAPVVRQDLQAESFETTFHVDSVRVAYL